MPGISVPPRCLWWGLVEPTLLRGRTRFLNRCIVTGVVAMKQLTSFKRSRLTSWTRTTAAMWRKLMLRRGNWWSVWLRAVTFLSLPTTIKPTFIITFSSRIMIVTRVRRHLSMLATLTMCVRSMMP